MTLSKKSVQSSWLNFANKKSIEDGSFKKLIERGITGLNFFLSLFTFEFTAITLIPINSNKAILTDITFFKDIEALSSFFIRYLSLL